MIRINAITFLNYLVSGALTLIIPLLLLERNMNLAEIGIILSILPIIFLFARLLFAAIADYLGWSHIFILANWPSTVGSIIIYYFANSTPLFMIGKIAEGLRESSYWAVIRTAIYHISPKKAGAEATKNNAIAWISTAVGSAIAGLIIACAGFSMSLIILALISLTLSIPVLMLRKASKSIQIPKAKKLLSSLNPRGRSKLFWIASLALMFNSLSSYPLVTLLLPVFLDQNLGCDYLTIGLIFLLFNAVTGVAAFFSLKRPLSSQRAIILTAISIVASFFLSSYNIAFFLALIALAFVRGYGIGYFEYTILKVIKKPENVSVDIGLIHTPQRIAEFASILAAGFLVQTIGYTPVFVAIGACFGFYAIIALYVIQKREP